MEYCWNYKMENFSGKKLFLRNDGRIHWFVEKKFSHSFSFDILSILFVIFNKINEWKMILYIGHFLFSLRSPCTNLPFRFLVSDVLYLSCAQASPEQNELCRRVSNTPSSPIRFSLSTVHFLSFFFFIIRFYPIFLYNQSIQLNLI